MEEPTVKSELPRYRCHKDVWALKITKIEDPAPPNQESDGHRLIHADGFNPISVPLAYIRKHSPTVGGYYVRYADGYESFSPAEAFESGYTRVN